VTTAVVRGVAGIQQAAVRVLGVVRQMAYVASIIFTLVPIRRDRVKMPIPAARLHVANVWRTS
jgi:hypothetical protein